MILQAHTDKGIPETTIKQNLIKNNANKKAWECPAL
jgi:hypothetical protein